MGMTNFYMGSLRYDYTGRKRKKHAANPVRKKKPEFKPQKLKVTPQLQSLRQQQAKQYKSLMEEYMASGTYHTIAGDTSKKEPMKYTGTLIKGIATMHKSNAIPVINDEQAKDIARMRRG